MAYINAKSLNEMFKGAKLDLEDVFPVIAVESALSRGKTFAPLLSTYFQIWLAKKAGDNATIRKRLLCSAAIELFTGNCGAKAISAINLSTSGTGIPGFDDKLKYHMLFMFENYLYTMMECSLVVGSDNSDGLSIANVKRHGKNYKFGNKVWNSRYENEDHTIRLFYKDLSEQRKEYADEHKNWRDL